MSENLRLLFYYKNIGKYALNALAGSLQSHHPKLELSFAKTEQQLIKTLTQKNRSKFTLVLWTFYSAQFETTRHSLERVKQQTASISGILHMAGGVHCSAMPESALAAGFDYVACGEGEELIVQFTQALAAGEFYPEIRGLCFLDTNGCYVYQGRAIVDCLDHYPPGSDQHRKFGPVEITRGCVYACRFCQTPYVNKARFRHRSVESCVDFSEIMYSHGLRDFRFISPTSLSYGSNSYDVNLNAIESLLSGLRSRLGADAKLYFGSFPSEVRPEHISSDVLRLLKQYVDNDNLIIGAQSGSNSVLDSCRRGHNVDQVRQASDLCLQHGFRPNVDFLFGLPGESVDDRQLSLDFAEELSQMGAKIHLHSFMPLPGTPYADHLPGHLEKATVDRLNKLCSSGKAYGQWQHQTKSARTLSKLN